MRKVFLKVMCITMLSLVMSITMLSSVSAKEASIEYQGVWTDYAAKKYAAGDGTKESPYLIKDASELALLAKNVNEKEEKDKVENLDPHLRDDASGTDLSADQQLRADVRSGHCLQTD